MVDSTNICTGKFRKAGFAIRLKYKRYKRPNQYHAISDRIIVNDIEYYCHNGSHFIVNYDKLIYTYIISNYHNYI